MQISIMIAISDNYIEPAKNMLYSLGYNNPNEFDVYLMYSNISDEKILDLKEYVNVTCHGNLIPIQVSKQLFANAPKQKWWSEEMYYRMISFDILPYSLERCLWLDADIVINGNILEFYNQSFDDSYAVVCRGCNQTLNKGLGLPNSHKYFNSGVMLFNFKKIREDFTIEKVFKYLNLYKDRLKAPDQDLLNIMFKDNLKYANENIYNHETFGNYVLSKEKMKLLHNSAIIIHYDGPVKPWNPKGINWADDLWWKYERLRGRNKEYIMYRVKNLPIKLYQYCREFYFMGKSLIVRIVKR